MVTREHILGGRVTPSNPSQAPVWDGGDLQRPGLPYVSTTEYAQPPELVPRPRFLNCSADWWSLVVSKIEFLRVRPSFDDEEETATLVQEALQAGELEGMLRENIEADLRPAAASSDQATAIAGWWARYVLAKLEGRPADG